MPLINLKTSNINIENPEALLKVLSKELSNLTGKPETYVMTALQTDVAMTYAGSNEPCCFVEIKSIGSLDPVKMSSSFCELIESRTGIPTNRIYIEFEDVPASLWGWDGRTFG